MMHALLLTLALGAAPGVNKEAQRYYNKSKIEYNAGDFEKALKDATEAYELEPAPGLLYNLGQCHRALHHWERAEFFYRGYLREKPDAPNREAVEALIAQMVAKQQEEAAAAGAVVPPAAAGVAAIPAVPAPVVPVIVMGPEAAPAPAPKPIASAQPTLPSEAVHGKSSGGGLPAGFWFLGGGGVGCAVVGTLFALGASNLRNGDLTTNGAGNNPSLIFHQQHYQQFGEANSDALIADGLFIVGGGLIVAAIIVAVTAPSHPPTTHPLAFNF